MTNREIENKIKMAFESATPDVFEGVLCKCEENPQVAYAPKIRKFNIISVRKIVSIAAAIVIVVTAGAVGFGFLDAKRIDSVISLDVNPSIELDINKKERIIKAEALNEDAEIVLDGMNLEGSDISVAVNAVIGSMLRNGYIDELANSILISVDNKNEKRGKELKERLSKEVKKLLNTDSFNGAVISQTIKKEDNTASLAEKYGITKGKVQLIQQIVKTDSKYEFEDLVSLNINDLNLILSRKKTKGAVASSGKASEKQYIGKKKAKKIALKKADVSESDIFDYECELDYKDGAMLYEIEWKTKYQKFECDINAKSGKIIKFEVEQNKEDSETKPKEDVEYIDEAKVKEIALARAGATEDDITDYVCELENDDKAKYDIRFFIGSVKYFYEIDSTTGAVIGEKHEETDNNSSESNQSDNGNNPKEYIGEDKAKEIAVAHAGLQESEIINFNCLLNTVDGVAVYDLEFFDNSGNKYSFWIDAKLGVISNYENGVDQDANQSQEVTTESEKPTVTYISRGKAKEIALRNVGVNISDVANFECEFEADEQTAVYEISFMYKDMKCSCEIDAKTGEVLDVEKEIADDSLYAPDKTEKSEEDTQSAESN